MGDQNPTIDVGRVVQLPDDHHRHPGEWVELIDWKRPYEYQPGVWAYADPESGEYGGLVVFEDESSIKIRG